jgi:hypothetical protein
LVPERFFNIYATSIEWSLGMTEGRVERPISTAGKLERKYDWLGAATLYRDAMNLVSALEFLKKGEMQERIGHCLYRAAFQTDGLDEFRGRMQRALDAYTSARGFYAQLTSVQKVGRVFRCDAIASYLHFWLTADPSEQRRRLDDCLAWEAEALEAFSEAGNMVECGRTYGTLPHVFWLRARLEWSGQARERIYRRGIEWGKRAVAALSAVDAFPELAQAYYTLAHCLAYSSEFIADPEQQKQALQKVAEYLNEAGKLGERTENTLLRGLCSCDLVWLASEEESRERADEALRCGEETRDRSLIAWSLSRLVTCACVKAFMEEDPAKFRDRMGEAFQFYDRAHRLYSSIPIPSLCGDIMDFPYGWLVYYHQMAYREVIPERRLDLLTKAEAAGVEALRLAESSDSPDYTRLTLAYLSGVHLDCSGITANLAEKRRRLKIALKAKERVRQIREETIPFRFQERAVGLTVLAITMMHFADTEPDPKAKQRLLEEASLNMENGSTLYAKALVAEQSEHQRFILGVIARDQDERVAILTRLYQMTRTPEYLRRAIAVSQEFIASARKLGWHSRIAESHWHIARAYDALGEYVKSAASFKQAAESYGHSAKKLPPLTDFYANYGAYMRAWANIEQARYAHAHENHAKSRTHYRRCAHRLERTTKWAYLAPYYAAWSHLEQGEALSRRDKPDEAAKAFREAERTFADSAKRLGRTADTLTPSEEREEAVKLSKMAAVRQQYCTARGVMEAAKLASRAGDCSVSAAKFAAAARTFEAIAPNLEREDAHKELQFAAALCNAWEIMERAQDREDATLYEQAAALFAKAAQISQRKTAKLTAMGTRCFCEALARGTQFLATSRPKLYAEAKTLMEHAAGYYQRAGAEAAALWAEATKRLFDAYIHFDKAEAAAEAATRARLYSVAEKWLELAAESYGKAGYCGKRNEVLQGLERARKEHTLAVSLSESLSAGASLLDATSVVAPESTEQAAGLNSFESANIQARVAVPKEFVPGEAVQLKLDMVNVGKASGLLVRIDGLVPAGCEVRSVSSSCTVEGTSLNLGGRLLDPLAMESVTLTVHITNVTTVHLAPQVVYVDDHGQFQTLTVEATRMLPVVTFASPAAQAVFSYLVHAFVEDRVRLRRSLETAGWRSCPQIIKGAGVTKRSLYGRGGRLGPGVTELQRKGLVDVETLHGARGRGGHILRVRIHHKTAAVRQYVHEKAPDLLT